MVAYAVVILDVEDRSWIAEYVPAVREIVKKHGGRYLVQTNKVEQIEEAGLTPTDLVIAEYPSVQHVKNFYEDPDYERHLAARKAGSTTSFLIAEGV